MKSSNSQKYDKYLTMINLQEYIKERVCEAFEAFGTGEQQVAVGAELLFKKTLKSVLLLDAIKEELANLKKQVSTGNMSQMKPLHKRIVARAYRKADLNRISMYDMKKLLRDVGISSEQGLGNLLADEAESLAKAGCSYSMIKEGRSKDKHRKEGKKLLDSGQYIPGQEIDLDYNGDGFDGYSGNVVVRTQDGQGPMMLYGYNGDYVSNDIRNIYAYETGEPYMWCSGIQLEKWKRVDDTRKRSCARDQSLVS